MENWIHYNLELGERVFQQRWCFSRHGNTVWSMGGGRAAWCVWGTPGDVMVGKGLEYRKDWEFRDGPSCSRLVRDLMLAGFFH